MAAKAAYPLSDLCSRFRRHWPAVGKRQLFVRIGDSRGCIHGLCGLVADPEFHERPVPEEDVPRNSDVDQPAFRRNHLRIGRCRAAAADLGAAPAK